MLPTSKQDFKFYWYLSSRIILSTSVIIVLYYLFIIALVLRIKINELLKKMDKLDKQNEFKIIQNKKENQKILYYQKKYNLILLILKMSDTDEQLDNQVHIFLRALYYLSEKMGATLTKGEQEYAFEFKRELNKLYNLNNS